jgi:thymidylate synthase ThyX
MIEAKIVADSITVDGNRIISYILTYPRFIHSELMTHRMFSRNAASSRAIPIEKMIDRILNEPAGPVYWGKNQKGMQAGEELTSVEIEKAIKIWIASSKRQVKYARLLSKLGVHKQIANRLLEPFAHMTTLVTSTEWGNFFNLRAHPEAQPEFQELAYEMLELHVDHQPALKKPGEWHLPFADKYISEGLSEEELLKITTARAARTSYMNFEGNIEHEKDYDLHDKLMLSGHWSPFEHPAQAPEKGDCKFYGNFRGWIPYRKRFISENKTQFDPQGLLSRRGKTYDKKKNTLEKMDRLA